MELSLPMDVQGQYIPRTRVEKLLMEILFQKLRGDSDRYKTERLALAGLTPSEIQALTE
jgi:hypothetical protein